MKLYIILPIEPQIKYQSVISHYLDKAELKIGLTI